jgi:hypothetical protein
VRPFEPGGRFDLEAFAVRTAPTQHNVADSAGSPPRCGARSPA